MGFLRRRYPAQGHGAAHPQLQQEIAEEVLEDQVFFFGNLAPDVEELRHNHLYRPQPFVPELESVVQEIRKGTFGDPHIFE